MNGYAGRVRQNSGQSVADAAVQQQPDRKSAFQFVDRRPAARVQSSLMALAGASPQARRAERLQAAADNSPRVRTLQSIARLADRRQPVQMKWVDEEGTQLAWDRPVDGVQWYYVKDTGLMYFTIIDRKAIKIGRLEAYQALQGIPHEYDFWKAHSAIDLDVTGRLDRSVIRRDEVQPGPDGGPTGMAAMGKGGFLDAARQVETGWSGKSPSDRAGALVAGVNEYLAGVGVPRVRFELKKSDEDSYGSFSESTWVMTLNEGKFSRQAIGKDEMAAMADTVFHEARHAEQFYRIAQMLAGFGYSVEQIRDKMQLNAPINATAAADAYAHSMALDPNGLSTACMEALEWYQSLYGARAEVRKETILTKNQVKLELHTLWGQMQALKSERMLLRIEGQDLKMETESKQLKLESEVAEIRKKIEARASSGAEDSAEVRELRTEEARLRERFAVLARTCNEALAPIRGKMEEISKQQAGVKEEWDRLLPEFERLHESYQALPEERDAWALGGAIQEAYKKPG